MMVEGKEIWVLDTSMDGEGSTVNCKVVSEVSTSIGISPESTDDKKRSFEERPVFDVCSGSGFSE